MCLFDSVVFYSLNYFSEDIYIDLIIGNVIGKQLTVIFLSITIYIYLILIGKKGSWDGFKADSIYSIVVKDSLSTIMYYSSDSELSTIIADKYKIGDKIR